MGDERVTGEFKQLLTVGGSSLSPGDLLGSEGNRLFVGNTLWTVEFDLPSDTARYVSLECKAWAPSRRSSRYAGGQACRSRFRMESQGVHRSGKILCAPV